jgi:putative phosphoribosyl transferase
MSWRPWSDAGNSAVFADRRAAGRELADELASYAGRQDAVALGLPRGGMVVADELAHRLDIALDVFIVRKLGVPGHEELAFGALASGGVRVLNDEIVGELRLSKGIIEDVTRREQAELERRERLYRADKPAADLQTRVAILIDDGLATGSTMRAAIKAAAAYEPERVVVAVPVAPAETCTELRGEADEVICLRTPEPFYAVGMWYVDFMPVSDDEVRRILAAG